MNGQSHTIRTGFGDDGYSDAGDGRRIPKDDSLFSSLGSIDELQTSLGVCRVHLQDAPASIRRIAGTIEQIQQHCLDAGAALYAIARGDVVAEKEFVVERDQLVEVLKNYESKVPRMGGFSLAGKDLRSAELERTRTVARRAERELVRYLGTTGNDSGILSWINVVSDLLFVFARFCETATLDTHDG